MCYSRVILTVSVDIARLQLFGFGPAVRHDNGNGMVNGLWRLHYNSNYLYYTIPSFRFILSYRTYPFSTTLFARCPLPVPSSTLHINLAVKSANAHYTCLMCAHLTINENSLCVQFITWKPFSKYLNGLVCSFWWLQGRALRKELILYCARSHTIHNQQPLCNSNGIRIEEYVIIFSFHSLKVREIRWYRCVYV